MAIHKPMENLYIVDLDQPLEGFYNFLNSWVYRQDGLTIAVDPGPRSTIPVLVEALKAARTWRSSIISCSRISTLTTQEAQGCW